MRFLWPSFQWLTSNRIKAFLHPSKQGGTGDTKVLCLILPIHAISPSSIAAADPGCKMMDAPPFTEPLNRRFRRADTASPVSAGGCLLATAEWPQWQKARQPNKSCGHFLEKIAVTATSYKFRPVLQTQAMHVPTAVTCVAKHSDSWIWGILIGVRSANVLVITFLLPGHLVLILIWWGNARQISPLAWLEMASKSLEELLLWFMYAGSARKNICQSARGSRYGADVESRHLAWSGKERDCAVICIRSQTALSLL